MMGTRLLLLEGSYTSDCSTTLNALNRNLVSRYLQHPPLQKYLPFPSGNTRMLLLQMLTLDYDGAEHSSLLLSIRECIIQDYSWGNSADEPSVRSLLLIHLLWIFTGNNRNQHFISSNLQKMVASLLVHGNCTGRKRTKYDPYSNQATLGFGVF